VGECPVGQAFPHCQKVPVRKGGAKIVAGNKLKEWEGNFYLIYSKRSGLGGDPESRSRRISGSGSGPNSQSLLKFKAEISPNYFDLGIVLYGKGRGIKKAQRVSGLKKTNLTIL
jgi:hypothetical protein